MKHLLLLLLALSLATTAARADDTVWSIGQPDNSAADLALGPDKIYGGRWLTAGWVQSQGINCRFACRNRCFYVTLNHYI